MLYERQADGNLKILSIKSKLTKSQKNNRRRRMKKQAERAERECQARMDEWRREYERERQAYATDGRA